MAAGAEGDAMSVACSCPTKTVAKDVWAIVAKSGYLTSHEAMEPSQRKKVKPVKYERLVFCSRPTCEKVHKAEKKQ